MKLLFLLLLVEQIIGYEILPKGPMIRHIKTRSTFKDSQREGPYSMNFVALGQEFYLELEEYPMRKFDYCVYHGTAPYVQNSSAVISDCYGYVSGIIQYPDETFYLSPIYKNFSVIVSSSNETLEAEGNCGDGGLHDDEVSEWQPETSDFARGGGVKYVNLLLVTDKARLAGLDGNPDALRASTLAIASQIKFIYEQFKSPDYKIEINIAGIYHMLNDDTSWDDDTDSNVILGKFTTWVNLQPWRTRYSSVQLLSGIDFDSTIVGRAYMSTFCNPSGPTMGVVQATSSYDFLTAKITAHELGHNLGMRHTNTYVGGSSLSTEEQIKPCMVQTSAVMSSILYGTAIVWDSCSVEWFKLFNEGYPYGCTAATCTYPYGVGGTCMESGTPICGNTMIDADEECDCGPPDFCKDPCCDAKTCTLVKECSPKQSPCCTASCTVAKGGICRPSAHPQCDEPDSCDGHSEECLEQRFKPTGDCDVDGVKGRCYKGHCLSLDIQCLGIPKAYWTSEGINGECPRANVGDIACKKLYCKRKDSDYCDYYNAPSLLMVKNGTPCGDGRVCIDEKCISVEISDSPVQPSVGPTKTPSIYRKPSTHPTAPTKSNLPNPTSRKPTKTPTGYPTTTKPTKPLLRPPSTAPTSMPTDYPVSRPTRRCPKRKKYKRY